MAYPRFIPTHPPEAFLFLDLAGASSPIWTYLSSRVLWSHRLCPARFDSNVPPSSSRDDPPSELTGLCPLLQFLIYLFAVWLTPVSSEGEFHIAFRPPGSPWGKAAFNELKQLGILLRTQGHPGGGAYHWHVCKLLSCRKSPPSLCLSPFLFNYRPRLLVPF